MILPAFTYRVDIRGAVYQGDVANGVDRQDQVDASLKSAQLFVDGVQRPQGWLSNFAQAERDLLRVAAAVLDLDRLSLRRPRNTRNEKRELHWRRVFTVEIAVEDLTNLDPNVRFVLGAPTGGDVTADVAQSRTVEMYRRYAAEIRRFLVAARPTLRPHDPHPAKEVARDLFAAAR